MKEEGLAMEQVGRIIHFPPDEFCAIDVQPYESLTGLIGYWKTMEYLQDAAAKIPPSLSPTYEW